MPTFGRLEQFSRGEDWSEYVEVLTNYFGANRITAATQKRQILLASVGRETYHLIKTLLAPASPDSKSFDEIVQVLRKHLDPPPSKIVSRCKFNSRNRFGNESISDYVVALKRLAQNCDFGETHSIMLRDRLVCGVANERIQSRLLSEPDKLTFDEAYEIALTMESAAKDTRDIQMVTASATSFVSHGEVHKVQGPKGKCFSCGGDHLRQNCKFKDAECHFCNRKGHISSVCRSRMGKSESVREVRPQDTGNSKFKFNGYKGKNSTHSLEVVEEPTSADSANNYSLYAMTGGKSEPPVQVTIQIAGKPLVMEVDTGASRTLISESTYKSTFFMHKMSNPTCALSTYTGQRISVLGELQDIDIQYGSQEKKLTLLVVAENGPSLLGRDWLRCITLDWRSIFKVHYTADSSAVQKLVSEYDELFDGKLGKFSGPPATIHMAENATPRFFKPRPVPYSYRELVEKEVERNIATGVWEPVRYSEYASPLVPILKSDGSVRLCIDYKVTVNEFCKVDSFPLPRIEDIYAGLAGGQFFSKIDLQHAYTQIPVHEDSQKYLTVNTHLGLFRVTRLPFGIAAAPAIFQRIMSNLLSGVKGVAVFLDDLLVTGSTPEEHLENLRQVLNRLKEAGLKLKKGKCEFMASSVEYLGHKIDAFGLHPTSAKIKSIQNTPPPENADQLKAFIGGITYYAKFIPNLSTILAPLHSLLKKGVTWSWTDVQQSAFEEAKSYLQSDAVLVHYDAKLPVILECDASPYGLGAVLSHKMLDGSERPIAMASRTLNPAEKNYAHLEREALSLVFGVCRFHQYLAGREFLLRTDNKPISFIFKENKAIPQMASARIQRWALTLSAYKYKLEFKAGKFNSNADALSRLPARDSIENVPLPGETVLWTQTLDSSSVTSSQIRLWTSHDPVLSKVREWIVSGWPLECPSADFTQYFSRKDELSTDNGCVLWGNRVVIPAKGQEAVLELLHDAHVGVVRMKALARSFVWWSKIDMDIENTVRKCAACERLKGKPQPAELHPWEWPCNPWQRIHIDHAGPFKDQLYLVVVDAMSKWMEVIAVSSTSASVTITKLLDIFCTHGLPDQIVSDNGTGFASEEFAKFCAVNGIKRTLVAVRHPASNGLAERAVQTFKEAIKRMDGEKLSMQEKLKKFLFRYRITPQSTTGVSPAELLLKRRPKSHLDLLRVSMRERVEAKQWEQKIHHDNNAVSREFAVDAKVFAFDGKQWSEGTVIQRTGPVSYLVKREVGDVVKRHIDHLRIRHSSDYGSNINSVTY